MSNFFPIRPECFGMDISESAIRVAKLRRRGEFFNLAGWGESKIEAGVIKDGEIKEKPLLIKSIKEALKGVRGQKIKRGSPMISLPASKAFLQVIKMPRMTESELGSAILFESENYIPFSIEEVYLDFSVVRSDKNSQYVLVAACPKTIIDSYLDLFKEVGLSPVVFEPESMAICRALIHRATNCGETVRHSPIVKSKAANPVIETPSSGVGILDLDETRADFIVFSDRAIRFTSSFLLSGQDFSLLANQTKQYIDYCYSHSLTGNKEIGEILISGEGRDLEKLAASLFRELRIQTKLGNPWVNILSKGKKIPFSPQESLKYTIALGLAIRAAKYD